MIYYHRFKEFLEKYGEPRKDLYAIKIDWFEHSWYITLVEDNLKLIEVKVTIAAKPDLKLYARNSMKVIRSQFRRVIPIE
jgi:hypothetical protein